MEFDDLHLDRVAGDLARLRREFEGAAKAGSRFGSDVTGALAGIRSESGRTASAGRDLGRVLGGVFDDVIVRGKSLREVLKSLATELAKLAAENIFGGGGSPVDLTDLFGAAVTPNAKGNVLQRGRVRAFARGGVLSEPSVFPMRGGLGLAGEAGPEAILPLARGADGRLGVTTQAQARPISITFNVTAGDAESFRRSETQIAAMLQRTLARGTRNL